MKNTTSSIRSLFLFLLFLFLFAGVFSLLWPKGSATQEDLFPEPSSYVLEMKISSRNGEDFLHVEKRGSNWLITSPLEAPAEEKLIKNMLEHIELFTSDSKEQLSESQRSKYHLDGEQGTRLELYTTSKTYTYIIGKVVPGRYSHSYIEYNGYLYEVPGIQAAIFPTNHEQLRSNDVVLEHPEDITEVVIRQEDETVRFLKVKGLWTSNTPTTVGKEEDILGSLLPLGVRAFRTPDELGTSIKDIEEGHEYKIYIKINEEHGIVLYISNIDGQWYLHRKQEKNMGLLRKNIIETIQSLF